MKKTIDLIPYIKWISLVVFFIGMSTQLISQNRAPSLYLNYQDNFSGDIITNTLNVNSPSPLYTYYCGLLWNTGQDAGGYCGIQEHPQGKNFIFSLWDPVSVNQQINTTDYTHPSTQIDRFGGEGIGLRSLNYGISWEEESWITLLSRNWTLASNPNSTYFGFWIKKSSDNTWYHIVTMIYPVGGLTFNNSTRSFIEDWLGNGYENRRVNHRQGWKRHAASKNWTHFDVAEFDRVYPDAGTVNYIDNYDGGVENNTFFMSSGGTISPVTNTEGTFLNVTTQSNISAYTPGTITSCQQITVTPNLHRISWTVDQNKLPQFSATVKIYDGNLNLFSSIPQVKPHVKQINFNPSNLPTANYFYQIVLTDVFDNIYTSPLKSFLNIDCPPNYTGINKLTGTVTGTKLYDTDGLIESEQIIGGNVQYDSGRAIELTQGFDSLPGSVFDAFIDGCGGSND